MAGWIRIPDGTLWRAGSLNNIRVREDPKIDAWAIAADVAIAAESAGVLTLLHESERGAAEIELNRLQAWLNAGGEGVYVVGEWPYPPRGSECESCGDKATHMDRDGGTFCCECWATSGGGEISREPAGDGAVAELVAALEEIAGIGLSFSDEKAADMSEIAKDALSAYRGEASA